MRRLLGWLAQAASSAVAATSSEALRQSGWVLLGVGVWSEVALIVDSRFVVGVGCIGLYAKNVFEDRTPSVRLSRFAG